MLYVRNSDHRGKANFGWLDSRHTFSFGHYYDPQHMGFSVLRVINDDKVDPGAGFDTHGHRDMEIISYVLDGVIAHKDSMGNLYEIPAGDIQVMSAGTGVLHSEFNASASEPLQFLQIWIQPDKLSVKPNYEQMAVSSDKPVKLLVSPDGRDNSLRINQDARIYRIALNEGASQALDNASRANYLHVVSGSVTVTTATGEVVTLNAGDGIGIQDEGSFRVEANARELEVLWFDLPPARH
ncbi:MAG: pirin family protein [bacterium]